MDQWEDQAHAMTVSRALPLRHLEKARVNQAFTASNLKELTWFRSRVGLKMAFLEDPLMAGMLVMQRAKGLKYTLNKEAMAEAARAAQVAEEQGQRLQAARQLIGPRGGLPTLRKDLVNLAALLKVDVDPKATVDELKVAVRPMIDELKKIPEKSQAASSSALQGLPQQGAAVAKSSAPTVPPPLMQPINPGVTQEEVMKLFELQDQKVRMLFEQVMNHMHAPPMPAPVNPPILIPGMEEEDDIELVDD